MSDSARWPCDQAARWSKTHRRVLVLAPLLLLSAGGCRQANETVSGARGPAATHPLEAPREELYVAEDRSVLLAAARQIIETDPVATLISIDTSGRARARTVQSGGPDEDWSFWVTTRPGTRKIAQIEEHPEVTLHFETDDGGAYVSVMGRARIHRGEVTLFEQKSPIDPELMSELFPNYPDDCLLIEIRPIWLELLSMQIEASSDTWRPQAVVFDPADPLP